MFTQKDQNIIDTLRFLSIDSVEKAKSGHPGLPMGAAAMAFVLWKNHIHLNPNDPLWIGRDRFILSAGHGSALLYSILHLFGYKITIDDLKKFRQWESKTAGHPEYDPEIGIETTTGPLGQGFAASVGMSIAAKHLESRFSVDELPFNNFIYGICGDGDLQEGVSAEAASFAGHNKLGNLIYLYDDNNITIDGPTQLSFSEDVAKRFDAYSWHVQKVDGYDLEEIDNAISNAKNIKSQPSLIICKTHIGLGSPNKQDTSGVHGSPLGEEERTLTKQNAGWDSNPEFFVADETYEYMETILKSKIDYFNKWEEKYSIYRGNFPDKASDLDKLLNNQIPKELSIILPKFSKEDKIATRAASGKVINAIACHIPSLVGGSADLAPSNNTYIKNEMPFSANDYSGRNFHFGVREHAMGSIANGMAQFGGLIPYIGTFLVFSDYMRPAIRLAAMMNQQVIYIFTHDSIGLGEDGPTHQPVEHIAALRTIPGLTVIRPADANETSRAWEYALNHHGPTALILTRQGLPTLESISDNSDLANGAYVIWEATNNPEIIIIASGSEVSIAIDAAKQVYSEQNISARVVSMASWEIFDRQSALYIDSVLPQTIKKRIAIEAAIGQGWEKYGINSRNSIFMSSFGASAPANILFEKFGFTTENIIEKITTELK